MFAQYRLDDWQSPAFIQWYQQQLPNVQRQYPTWLPTRYKEFLAGRYCAMQALAQLGYVPTIDVLERNDKNRRAIWPEGYVGSISHHEGHAIAIVAHQTDYQTVGIDLEPWMQPNQALMLMPRLCTPDEQHAFLAQPQQLTQQMTILFSAKETLYKMLYENVEHYMGFQTAQLMELDQQLIRLQLNANWGRWALGTVFELEYQTEAWGVCTWASLRHGQTQSVTK
jgi:enterobactin synthetase component D